MDECFACIWVWTRRFGCEHAWEVRLHVEVELGKALPAWVDGCVGCSAECKVSIFRGSECPTASSNARLHVAVELSETLPALIMSVDGRQ